MDEHFENSAFVCFFSLTADEQCLNDQLSVVSLGLEKAMVFVIAIYNVQCTPTAHYHTWSKNSAKDRAENSDQYWDPPCA